MGLEREPPKKSKLPPVFTGEAIEIRLPDITVNNRTQQLKIVTFPDWLHKVYVDDKMYDVLGKDLEIGMAFPFEGIYVPIIDIDKKVLYHGMQMPNPLGLPCNPSEVKRKKFKRSFKKNGTQFWEISNIEDDTNLI
jgi:hypothetical protein